MNYRGYELVIYYEIVESFDGYADVVVYSGEIRKNGVHVASIENCASEYDVESEATAFVNDLLEGEDE